MGSCHPSRYGGAQVTRYTVLLSIAGCASVMTYAFVSHGLAIQGITTALLGMAWLVFHLRGLTRFTGFAFFLFGILSVFALWVGASIWISLAAMVLALLAWDLTAFEERLNQITDRDDIHRMELAHFTRLAIVIGLGAAGVAFSTLIQIDLTLGSALVFALLGIWGISSLVYRLRSRE